MELQKIHASLWDEIKQALPADAEVTHAFRDEFVFRPTAKARSVTLKFEPGIWKEIAAASGTDARLKRIGQNMRKLIELTMAKYANNPNSTVFRIEIDDRALDG